jgi:hypothetical protein
MPNLDPADYPDPSFIFVGQTNPMTWHNFALNGAFFSAQGTGSPDDFLPFIPNPNFKGDISPSDLRSRREGLTTANRARSLLSPLKSICQSRVHRAGNPGVRSRFVGRRSRRPRASRDTC